MSIKSQPEPHPAPAPTATSAPAEAMPYRLITQEESWRQDVQASVVETLEMLLERAKDGEFTGIAVAAACKDNCTLTSVSMNEQNGLLLGAVSRLQHRMLMGDSY